MITTTMSRPLMSSTPHGRRRRRDDDWNGDDGGKQQLRRAQRRWRSWQSERESGGRCYYLHNDTSRSRRSICGGVISGLMYGLLFAGGRSRVNAQFVDGGPVALTCDTCECTGSSDQDNSIVVFDNPSTGDRVSVCVREGTISYLPHITRTLYIWRLVLYGGKVKVLL